MEKELAKKAAEFYMNAYGDQYAIVRWNNLTPTWVADLLLMQIKFDKKKLVKDLVENHSGTFIPLNPGENYVLTSVSTKTYNLEETSLLKTKYYGDKDSFGYYFSFSHFYNPFITNEYFQDKTFYERCTAKDLSSASPVCDISFFEYKQYYFNMIKVIECPHNVENAKKAILEKFRKCDEYKVKKFNVTYEVQEYQPKV